MFVEIEKNSLIDEILGSYACEADMFEDEAPDWDWDDFIPVAPVSTSHYPRLIVSGLLFMRHIFVTTYSSLPYSNRTTTLRKKHRPLHLKIDL